MGAKIVVPLQKLIRCFSLGGEPVRHTAPEPGPQTAPCSRGLLWGTVIRPP